MSAPRTRQDVEREVRELLPALKPESHYVNDDDCWYSCPKAPSDCSAGCDNTQDPNVCRCGADARNVEREAELQRIIAALLAMGECEGCDGGGYKLCYYGPEEHQTEGYGCEDCGGDGDRESGTGLDQARIACGLAALKGEAV